jgi:hypothetical protein
MSERHRTWMTNILKQHNIPVYADLPSFASQSLREFSAVDIGLRFVRDANIPSQGNNLDYYPVEGSQRTQRKSPPLEGRFVNRLKERKCQKIFYCQRKQGCYVAQVVKLSLPSLVFFRAKCRFKPKHARSCEGIQTWKHLDGEDV